MSQMETLIQTDDAKIQIETTADVIKPIFGYARSLVKEAKIHFDSDGIHYTTIDPANVGMVELFAPKEMFDSYAVDETVVGLNLKRFMKALRAGRKRQGDEITLSYEDRYLTTTVNRDYNGTEMDLQTNFATIDPDSIRQEPDMPELEHPVSATVDRMLFEDAVSAVNSITDHIQFEDSGNDLLISGEGDTDNSQIAVRDVVEGEGADSMFSLDYITNCWIKGAKTVGIDEFTMHLAEEFPVRIEWEKEINDATMEGEFVLSPRVQA